MRVLCGLQAAIRAILKMCAAEAEIVDIRSTSTTVNDTDSDDDYEDILVDTTIIYHARRARRYVAPRIPLARAPDIYDYWLFVIDKASFKQGFRVTRLQYQKPRRPHTSSWRVYERRAPAASSP